MKLFLRFSKLENALEASVSFLIGVFEALAAVVVSIGIVCFISFLLAMAGIGMSMPPPLVDGKLHFVSQLYYILLPAALFAAVVFVLLWRTRPKK